MITPMTGPVGPKNSAGTWTKSLENVRQREVIVRNIDRMHEHSRRGLWRILSFLVITAGAMQARDFDLFAAVPAGVAEMLGAPPPTILVHSILAVSTICAVILIPARATAEPGRGYSRLQFWLSVAFYPLYAMGNTLRLFLPLVFAAGLAVLILEHLTIRSLSARAIREERERLGKAV